MLLRDETSLPQLSSLGPRGKDNCDRLHADLGVSIFSCSLQHFFPFSFSPSAATRFLIYWLLHAHTRERVRAVDRTLVNVLVELFIIRGERRGRRNGIENDREKEIAGCAEEVFPCTVKTI